MADTASLGRFVVFEGLDGSGSSTQASLLAGRLIERGGRVWKTSEPSSGPVGQLIRLFFSGRVILPPEDNIRDRQFAYLFAADRFDHLYNPTNGVLKHLSDGVDTVSTRYLFSSLAYNIENDGGDTLVRRLNNDFPNPDCLIYLDCPIELSMSRLSKSRAMLDTYENREKLNQVAANYKRIIANYNGRKLVVDASLPRKVIADRVFKFVSNTEPLLAASL